MIPTYTQTHLTSKTRSIKTQTLVTANSSFFDQTQVKTTVSTSSQTLDELKSCVNSDKEQINVWEEEDQIDSNNRKDDEDYIPEELSESDSFFSSE